MELENTQTPTDTQSAGEQVQNETPASETPTEVQVENIPATPEATQVEAQAEVVIPEMPAFELPLEKKEEPAQVQAAPVQELSVEEVAKRFDEKALLQSLGYDEFTIGLLDYYKKTGDVTPYLEVKTIDYSKVPDEKIIERMLKEQFASENLSEEDLKLLVQDELATRFKQDPDQFSEREVQLGAIRMKVEAEKYRKTLVEAQAQFKAPERTPVTEDVPTPAPQVTPQMVFQDWATQPEVQAFIQSKKLSMGDAQSPYNYEVDKPEMNLQIIADQNAYLFHVAKKNERGEVLQDANGIVLDRSKMLKVAEYIRNTEAVEKALINHGKTLGKKEVIDEAENVTGGKEHGTQGSTRDFWTVFNESLQKQ